MIYHELRPHPSLQASLACYFFLQRESNEPVSEELIIPDGTHGLMFVQQARFTRQSAAGAVGQRQVAGSYLFGQKTRPVRYVFDTPGLHCFGVKFQPHGLRAFTSLPSAELTDTLTEASPLLGKNFGALEDQLFSTNSMQEKKALLDDFFLKKWDTVEPEHRLVEKILGHVHRQQGQVGIAYLLQAFNLQYKRLERLFKKHVGVSPKTYCCITRFNATLLHHTRQRGDSLTQLAYTSGYFDQMHFIREVKHFTHLTPKAFYKNGLGSIASHQRQLLAERLV